MRHALGRRGLLIGCATALVATAVATQQHSAEYHLAFAPVSSTSMATGIYVADKDGTKRRLLVAEERMTALTPASWSPDGRTIAYHAVTAKDASGLHLPWHLPLYLVDVAKGARRRAVDFEVVAGHFGWSGDSGSLFVVSGFEDRTPPPPGAVEWMPKLAIYVVDVEWHTSTRVTELGSTMGGASWAPDGRRLVYSWRVADGAADELFVVNRDGSERRVLCDMLGAKLNPVWSPDGRSIVFTLIGKGPVVVDVASGSATEVRVQGSELGPGRHLVWTPDSRTLLVPILTGEKGGTRVLTSLDGKKQTTLTNIGGDAVFSPDGSELYYRTFDPAFDVWALRLSDGTRRKVVPGGGMFALSPTLATKSVR